MPAFVWSGNQGLDGKTQELFRVYVFTDRQCLNRVFTSAVVGSPAYAPRPLGPLALPTTGAAIATARTKYLNDASEPASLLKRIGASSFAVTWFCSKANLVTI